MTTPLTPPTFGDKFTSPTTDIGAGYAAGITSAGQSIAGAIGAVMGGINQRTGEAQEGILDQKKSAEDTIDMLHLHGMLTDDEYAKAKTSGLGAQQKIIGMNAADFNMKLKAQIEQQNDLAKIAAQNQGAMARTQVGESGAMARTQAEQQAATERARLAEQSKRQTNPIIRRGPTTIPNSAITAPVPGFKLNLRP